MEEKYGFLRSVPVNSADEQQQQQQQQKYWKQSPWKPILSERSLMQIWALKPVISLEMP